MTVSPPKNPYQQRIAGRNATNALKAGGRGRETMPVNFNPYATGVMGIIPRRGVFDPFLFTKMWSDPDFFTRQTHMTTMRMLQYLPDIHPEVGMATNTMLRLTCGISDLAIDAVKPSAPGAGDDQVDEEGTEDLKALWASLPNEIGGLQGLRVSLTLLAAFTGLTTAEAVPGPPLTGVRRVWPVDSMTILFARKDLDADLTPYQYQWIPWVTAGKALEMCYKELNTDTFFWRALDNWPDDPYGRGMFASSFHCMIKDLAMEKDIFDMMHHVAWPRLQIGFNFSETYKIATDIVGIRDPLAASEWVWKQFQEYRDIVAKLKADDALIHDTNGTSDIIEGGKGLGNLAEILAYLRAKRIQSLKSLPTLMGINDGSTQTYTSVEWAIYAATLETLRDMVIDIIIQISNLHLRLLGKALKAKARFTPIRTNDELVDANTQGVKIVNAIKKLMMGWITYEQACIEITGSGPAADAAPSPSVIARIVGAALPPPSPDNSDSDEEPPQKDPDTDG